MQFLFVKLMMGIFRLEFFQIQMRILFLFLRAKYLRTSLLIMRTCSFFYSPVYRVYTHTKTRRKPAPSTCTAASLCDGDRGLHLTTSTVGTTPPWGRGVGRGRLNSDADADADANAVADADADADADANVDTNDNADADTDVDVDTDKEG